MKFITDDIARLYALRVAAMRARQVEHVALYRLHDVRSAELLALEAEVDKLTIAMLDDRSDLQDEPPRKAFFGRLDEEVDRLKRSL